VATPAEQTSIRAAGSWAAVGAFGLWGVLPVYWKQVQNIPALELIAHRVVWSLLLLFVVVRLRGGAAQFRAALRDRRVCGLYLLSSGLLAANWLIYVWGVNSDRIVETSLGYFLNPLCNVALGFFLLRERLRPLQWTAVAFAAAGVAVQLIRLGRLPWIALSLAATFSLYGLLRKRGPLGPVAGLGLETLLIAPIAAVYLLWLAVTHSGALGHVSATQHALVFGTGVITSVPLLLFATAARALPLSVLGVFQYLAPSCQFLLGVLVYDEPFGSAQAVSFSLIWLGLALFTVDNFRANASARRTAVKSATTAAS
jgi:chloramphenicol-sensitive protein RarD